MQFTRVTLIRLGWLLVTVFSAVGVMVAPNPVTTPSIASAPLRTIRGTDVNPLGATFFLDREVEPWKREQTVKMARDAGIGWAKIMFSWQEIEPRKDRFYDDRYRKSSWEKFHDIVALSEKYGIRLIARLDKPADWALAEAGVTGDSGTPLAAIADYAAFAGKVAERYRGHVQYYQIWNEPNLAAEWGNRPPDAAGYTKLLQAATTAIKTADPDALVLSGPLAQTLERSERAVPETEYLSAMYQAGAGAFFDILFANAYGFERPPSEPARPDALNFQRVRLLRDIMVQQGESKKPVWLNESGWNAAPSNFPESKLAWGRVSEETQAEYTLEAIRIARSWDFIGVINIWYFRQVGDMSPSDRAEYYFRMVDVDFTPRLVYHAIRELAGTLKVAPPGIHQETSPAIDARGSWRHRVGPNGEGYLESDSPGSTLTVQFYGGDISLGVLRGPDGGAATVKIDSADSAGTPRTSPSRAAVNFSGTANGPDFVTVGANLAPGRHVLQLTVDGGLEGRGVVRVSQVRVGPSEVTYWPFFGQVALIVVGFFGLAGSFLNRRRATT